MKYLICVGTQKTFKPRATTIRNKIIGKEWYNTINQALDDVGQLNHWPMVVCAIDEKTEFVTTTLISLPRDFNKKELPHNCVDLGIFVAKESFIKRRMKITKELKGNE